jgi:hypothetical protein
MNGDELARGPDFWLGRGFWKLGYVTRDRDRAMEQLGNDVGIEKFETSQPTWGVVMADGRVGTATTRIAFSVGRPTTIELVEPIEGLVDCYADALKRTKGADLAFHHFGLVVSDIDAMKEAAAAQGVHPALGSRPDDPVRWVFYKPPQLDHYVEHLEPSDWIESLQTRSLARP